MGYFRHILWTDYFSFDNHKYLWLKGSIQVGWLTGCSAEQLAAKVIRIETRPTQLSLVKVGTELDN